MLEYRKRSKKIVKVKQKQEGKCINYDGNIINFDRNALSPSKSIESLIEYE